MYDKAVEGIMQKLVCRRNGLTYVAGKATSDGQYFGLKLLCRSQIHFNLPQNLKTENWTTKWTTCLVFLEV